MEQPHQGGAAKRIEDELAEQELQAENLFQGLLEYSKISMLFDRDFQLALEGRRVALQEIRPEVLEFIDSSIRQDVEEMQKARKVKEDIELMKKLRQRKKDDICDRCLQAMPRIELLWDHTKNMHMCRPCMREILLEKPREEPEIPPPAKKQKIEETPSSKTE